MLMKKFRIAPVRRECATVDQDSLALIVEPVFPGRTACQVKQASKPLLVDRTSSSDLPLGFELEVRERFDLPTRNHADTLGSWSMIRSHTAAPTRS